MYQTHPIPPLFDKNSKVLILGSFPSVKSREQGFFYGHPQNRFWRVLAAVFDAPVPQTVEEKTALVLQNHLALWDVIAACEITGSSDSSIKQVVPNAVENILDACAIDRIYTNGQTAAKLYARYLEPVLRRKAIYLPSTSPANAAWTLERLCESWQQVRTGE